MFENSKNATFSPIRGSSVPGKPIEYWNMTACPIQLWSDIDYLAENTSWVVKYFNYFFHTECIWKFTPGFHWNNGIYRRNYSERHYLVTLLWESFCVKCLMNWSAKESKFLSYMNFGSTYWNCCSIPFYILCWVFTT